MINSVLFRYLFFEMIGPFFVGLLGFIVFMITDMMFVLMDQVISRGVDIFSVIKIIIYRIPAITVIAIPVAILFGVVNSVTKLESGYEITSMRILGLRFYYIFFPFFVVSFIVAILSFFLNEKVVPLAMNVSEKIVKEKIIRSGISFIQSNVFFRLPDGKVVLVRSVDKRKKVLENVMIVDPNFGVYSRVMTSREGYIENLSIILKDGFVMDLGKDGFVKTQLKFEKMIIPFSLSFDDVIKELRNPWEMSYKDLKRELDSLDRMGWKDNFLLTQLYLKISLPLSCVIVVFLSLPLAVMFSRKGRFAGLLVSVLLIFFYYGLFSFFVAMGKNNLINPFFAAFGANFIMLFMGLMLVYLVER